MCSLSAHFDARSFCFGKACGVRFCWAWDCFRGQRDRVLVQPIRTCSGSFHSLFAWHVLAAFRPVATVRDQNEHPSVRPMCTCLDRSVWHEQRAHGSMCVSRPKWKKRCAPYLHTVSRRTWPRFPGHHPRLRPGLGVAAWAGTTSAWIEGASTFVKSPFLPHWHGRGSRQVHSILMEIPERSTGAQGFPLTSLHELVAVHHQ